MKRIVTSQQMRWADYNTSESLHVPSAVLMERAALAVADSVCALMEASAETKGNKGGRDILVAAGPGNNGGDGFAAGRILMERGFSVSFLLLGGRKRASQLEEEQILSVLALDSGIHLYESASEITCDPFVIVDGIFGISLNRDVEGEYARTINYVNSCRQKGSYVVSIDIPSGLNSDTGEVMGMAVHADLTVCCGYIKLGELLGESIHYTGEIKCADIGITEASFEEKADFLMPERQDITLPARRRDGCKGDFGKLLIAAGSEKMCGAAILSARAALKTGAGMVKVFTHESNRTAVTVGVPEALIETYTTADPRLEEKLADCAAWCDGAIAGPGLSTSQDARRLVRTLLREFKKKGESRLVIDADALNCIASDPPILEDWKRGHGTYSGGIITPHVGEMSRLNGKDISAIKMALAREAVSFAKEYSVTVVLKDFRTVTAYPEGRTFINVFGNSGMATAGSGDVLAGILGAVSCSEAADRDSAWKAVGIHALAGDAAAKVHGEHALTAGNIADMIGTLTAPGAPRL